MARAGLEQLPNGPVHNFGQPNDAAGMAPSSPDTRRARVLMIDQHAKSSFGEG